MLLKTVLIVKYYSLGICEKCETKEAARQLMQSEVEMVRKFTG